MRLRRGDQVRDLLQRRELRHLGHELLVVHGVHRVLVLELGHQQLQEVVLARAMAVRVALLAARGTATVPIVVGVTCSLLLLRRARPPASRAGARCSSIVVSVSSSTPSRSLSCIACVEVRRAAGGHRSRRRPSAGDAGRRGRGTVTPWPSSERRSSARPGRAPARRPASRRSASRRRRRRGRGSGSATPPSSAGRRVMRAVAAPCLVGDAQVARAASRDVAQPHARPRSAGAGRAPARSAIRAGSACGPWLRLGRRPAVPAPRRRAGAHRPAAAGARPAVRQAASRGAAAAGGRRLPARLRPARSRGLASARGELCGRRPRAAASGRRGRRARHGRPSAAWPRCLRGGSRGAPPARQLRSRRRGGRLRARGGVAAVPAAARAGEPAALGRGGACRGLARRGSGRRPRRRPGRWPATSGAGAAAGPAATGTAAERRGRGRRARRAAGAAALGARPRARRPGVGRPARRGGRRRLCGAQAAFRLSGGPEESPPAPALRMCGPGGVSPAGPAGPRPDVPLPGRRRTSPAGPASLAAVRRRVVAGRWLGHGGDAGRSCGPPGGLDCGRRAEELHVLRARSTYLGLGVRRDAAVAARPRPGRRCTRRAPGGRRRSGGAARAGSACRRRSTGPGRTGW